jgi:hypothetical protein
MKTVEDYEKIRKAYYVEGQSIRAISQQMRYSRKLIRQALEEAKSKGYQLNGARQAPVLGRIMRGLKSYSMKPRRCRASKDIPHIRSTNFYKRKGIADVKAMCIPTSARNGGHANTVRHICHWNSIADRMRRWIGGKRRQRSTARARPCRCS